MFYQFLKSVVKPNLQRIRTDDYFLFFKRCNNKRNREEHLYHRVGKVNHLGAIVVGSFSHQTETLDKVYKNEFSSDHIYNRKI